MQAWLSDAVARLDASPWLQGLLAALSTFVLEDPTTIGCGLLVADGRMAFTTALIGVASGIALGDVGLYGLGRWLGPSAVRRGWLSRERLDRTAVWFHRNLFAAVLLSRFVPGMRLPTFIGAGVLHAPFHRYVIVVVGASVAWTSFLLWVTVLLGEAVLPLLGRARWPLALGAIALFVYLQWRGQRAVSPPGGEDAPVVSRFEFWSPWFFYVPVGFYYAWLSLRYGGPMTPTAANPSIFSGGLIGESKSQILELVGEPQRRWVAPHVLFQRPAGGDLDSVVAEAEERIRAAGLRLPLVAKPDVGQRGAGVRPIRSPDDLRSYLLDFPAGRGIVFQTLVGDAPRTEGSEIREAGVLYWREPGTDRGNIFSITLKQMPTVVGDGRRTVRELIAADPRAARVSHLYLRRHAAVADTVLPQGETLELVFAGNHCQGAVFRDGTDRATPELLARIHEIACAMPEFWFGRFDLRFDDFDAFLRGEEMQIIEINGAGAEATHIWDASIRLTDAYATLFEQFRILFSIGAANRRRGHRPLSIGRFLREAWAYRRVARMYPLTQ